MYNKISEKEMFLTFISNNNITWPNFEKNRFEKVVHEHVVYNTAHYTIRMYVWFSDSSYYMFVMIYSCDTDASDVHSLCKIIVKRTPLLSELC